VRVDLEQNIQVFHDRMRRHSTLGHISAVVYQLQEAA
jgi:hypothetical protein